jgi:hypothetical protein
MLGSDGDNNWAKQQIWLMCRGSISWLVKNIWKKSGNPIKISGKKSGNPIFLNQGLFLGLTYEVLQASALDIHQIVS